MISEKDIKDFKEIDMTRAKQALHKVIYYGAHEPQFGEGFKFLTEMLEKIELLQKDAVKQVPALFKPIEGEQ